MCVCVRRKAREWGSLLGVQNVLELERERERERWGWGRRCGVEIVNGRLRECERKRE